MTFYQNVKEVRYPKWDPDKLEDSDKSVKILKFEDEKLLPKVSPIVLSKSCAIVSCSLERPRCCFVHDAPTRQLKTYTSIEASKIIDKKLSKYAGSDFTLNSLEEDRDIIKKGICYLINDATTLFVPNERSGYYTLKYDKTNIKSAILENPDFIDYSKKLYDAFHGWKKEVKPLLDNLNSESKPKELIADISEKLLSAFGNSQLLDKYDVYQRLMDYWSETMQDDVYLIASNGWNVEIDIVKNKKGKETGWKCDLIPKNIVISKYFQKEKEDLEKLMEEAENFVQQMETLDEENSGEDDLFSEVRNDSNKISRTEIKKRIREIRGNSEFADELKILQEYSNIAEHEAEIKRKIQDAEAYLNTKLRVKYNALTEEEIKVLVVESKWLKTLYSFVKNEIERVAQKLTRRIKELARRYETPLPKLTQNVQELSKNVDNHLKSMGFKW